MLVTVTTLLVPARADAGKLIDYIRETDLNDYSLGVAYTTSESPYVGSDNGHFFYPYLTSFTHSAFTDDWLLLRDENIGVRFVTDNQWEFGLVARFQALGTNLAHDVELEGVDPKQWAIETGPLIGWRAKAVNIQFRSYWEMPSRHSGFTSEIEFSLPIKLSRGFFVPAIRVDYLSDDYANYYYSVSDSESAPNRPAYEAGASTNVWAGFSMGYQIADKWLLKSNLGVEFMDSSITDSPIVDQDTLWTASVGLAYNADIFVSRDTENSESGYEFQVRLGAIAGSVSTTVERTTADGEVLDATDLENLLGSADNKTFLNFDGAFRINHFNQVRFGYFALERESATTLVNDHTVGDETYVAGTNISSQSETSLLRFSYAYSLMHDSQKELAIKAGVSYFSFEMELGETGSGEVQKFKGRSPLPTIGVLGELALGENWTLTADLDFFAMHFDRYEGYMGFLGFDLDRKFGETFRVGLGYNFFALHLEASDNDLAGSLDLRIHGPKIYVSATF